MTRARGWCFTLNNFLNEDEIKFKELEVHYICVGKEIGKSGTPHLQGFLYLNNPKGLPGMKKIDDKAHWEPMRGTPKQAADYCKKDGDFWESGTLPQQGKRTDLEEVASKVHSGASLEEIAGEHPEVFVKYSKGLTALKLTKMSDRTEKPVVVWLWGATGVGKTREAVSSCCASQRSFYIKDGTQWWDGYNQQDRIVIDDFDGKWPFRDLLRLLDRYPYQGQVKGGYVKINSKEIYITAEWGPDKFWEGTQLDQINRRIDQCTQVMHRSDR